MSARLDSRAAGPRPPLCRRYYTSRCGVGDRIKRSSFEFEFLVAPKKEAQIRIEDRAEERFWRFLFETNFNEFVFANFIALAHDECLFAGRRHTRDTRWR